MLQFWRHKCRNPLKSGQCFLLLEFPVSSNTLELACVAIPSNRVNVSYLDKILSGDQAQAESRNPLKSGQCFLQRESVSKNIDKLESRNPLKSGQCFLQHPSFFTHYRKLNTPFAGTSLFLCFPFPYLTYLLP